MTKTVATQKTEAELARKPIYAIIALSVGAALFIIWLDYFKGRSAEPGWVVKLPTADAIFNSISAICLVLGYINIRRGNRRTHMKFMLGAVASSALFLFSYITYHYFHGDTHFLGHGWIRPVYFTILISHIFLSAVALPLVFITLWFASRAQFARHRRIARWTFPIWLYVSVTGVIVYFVLSAYTP
jgi:putative membrane protein